MYYYSQKYQFIYFYRYINNNYQYIIYNKQFNYIMKH